MKVEELHQIVAIADDDRQKGTPRIVADGAIVVLQEGDRLFLFNRVTAEAFELSPNGDSGRMVMHQL